MSKHKSLSHLYNPIHHLVASLKSNAKQGKNYIHYHYHLN